MSDAVSFFSFPITHDSAVLSSIPHFPLMSHAHPTSTSSNFRLIFDNALKTYQKRTKKDLLAHPLADRLESCDSASDVLTVLREQVQELNESQHSFTKWLDPTVNVLHAFSETLGEGIGSVCIRKNELVRDLLSHIYLTGILTCKGGLYRIGRPSFGVFPS